MRGAQANHAFLWLARQQATLRQLDAVVNRVAQQVGQRCFKLFQHIAIDLGLFPLYRQLYRFAQRAAKVSDHTALAGQHIGERPHSAGQGGVVQQLCTLAGLPAEFVQIGGLLLQDLLGFGQQTLGLCQGFEHLAALATVLQLHAQAIKRLHTLAMHALEPLQGGQVRFEPLGFHQRLADRHSN